MDDDWTPPKKGPARASIHDVELLTQSKLWNSWRMRTTHSLDVVLAPGFFDNVTLAGLKRGDLVELLSDVNGAILHAMLVVTEANARDRLLKISLLQAWIPAATAGITIAVDAQESGQDTVRIN